MPTNTTRPETGLGSLSSIAIVNLPTGGTFKGTQKKGKQ